MTKLANIYSKFNRLFLLVPDPTLDDDNQSDSDEYEYEVIEEIEEVEVDTDELTHEDDDDEPEINTKSHSKHLTISEGDKQLYPIGCSK